jgi:phosphinothricin acetyltransferase
VSDLDLMIRRADLNDAAAIAEIYNEAIAATTATFDTEPKTVQDRQAWLASHDDRHPVLVAERAGKVVGWASLSSWSDRPAYADTAETSCYVAREYQGEGIGTALKVRLIEEARRVGMHTLLARIAEVGFKFGRRLDVHILQLMLAPDSP